MTHRWRMRAALLAFHEGTLPESERRALAHHIEGCPACAGELRRLAEADRLLRGAQPEPRALGPEAACALFERAYLASAVAERPTQPGFWRPLLGLAVAASLVFLLWSLGQRTYLSHNNTGTTIITRKSNPVPPIRIVRITPPSKASDRHGPRTTAPPPKRYVIRWKPRLWRRYLALGRHWHRRHSLPTENRPEIRFAQNRCAAGTRFAEALALALVPRYGEMPVPAREEAPAPVESRPPAHLFVMVTNAPEKPEALHVAVTQAAEKEAGTARVAAYQMDRMGGRAVTEYTVATEKNGMTSTRYTLAAIGPDLKMTYLAVQTASASEEGAKEIKQ